MCKSNTPETMTYSKLGDTIRIYSNVQTRADKTMKTNGD